MERHMKKRNTKKQLLTPRPARQEPEQAERTEWLDRIDPKGERHNRMVVVGLREITKDEANDWLSRVDPNYQRLPEPDQRASLLAPTGCWRLGGCGAAAGLRRARAADQRPATCSSDSSGLEEEYAGSDLADHHR